MLACLTLLVRNRRSAAHEYLGRQHSAHTATAAILFNSFTLSIFSGMASVAPTGDAWRAFQLYPYLAALCDVDTESTVNREFLPALVTELRRVASAPSEQPDDTFLTTLEQRGPFKGRKPGKLHRDAPN